MGLVDDLSPGPVGLDTAIFVYFMEENDAYRPLVGPLFEAIDAGRLPAVTSTLTLLETLVVPYRAGNDRLAREYEEILTRGRGLRLVELDPTLLRAAARLRATTAVKTPDAIQLAASLQSGCRSFLTNDRDLPPIPGIAVVQLRDYTRGPAARR